MYGIIRELKVNLRLNIYMCIHILYIYEYHQRMLYHLWLVTVEFYFIHEKVGL